MATGKVLLELTPREAYILKCVLDVSGTVELAEEAKAQHIMSGISCKEIDHTLTAIWREVPEIKLDFKFDLAAEPVHG